MMSHGVSLLLISAAAGYWVLTQAEREKSRVKKLGQFLGVVIIVVSLLGAACKIYYRITNCPPGAGGWFCPVSGKGMAPALPAQK